MKFILIFFLVALATSYANECSEETAEACIESLLESILSGGSEEEICSELSDSIDCLRDAVDKCLGDEVDEDVEEGLSELEKLLRDNCGGNKRIKRTKVFKETDDDGLEVDEEVTKCVQDNDDYILDCLSVEPEFSAESVEHLEICEIYKDMGDCLADRTKEKCGEEAGETMKNGFFFIPVEVYEACLELEAELGDLFSRKKK